MLLWFIRKKKKTSIFDISKYPGVRKSFIMIKKDLLLIPGYIQISIINTEQYKLVRKKWSSRFKLDYGFCMLNKNMLLTGDYVRIIRQWETEGDNLILVSKKEKAHDKYINVLLNIGKGFITSDSSDKTIKIW